MTQRHATGDVSLGIRNARTSWVFDAITRTTHEIPAFQLSLLEGAGHFAELETHATHACQRLQIDLGQLDVVVARLEELAKLGLLPSDADARSWLARSQEPPGELDLSPLPAPDEVAELEAEIGKALGSKGELRAIFSSDAGKANAAILGARRGIRFVGPGLDGLARTGDPTAPIALVENAPRAESEPTAADEATARGWLSLVGRHLADFSDRLVLDAATPRFIHRIRSARVRVAVFGALEDDVLVAPPSAILARSGPLGAPAVAVDASALLPPFFGAGMRTFLEATLQLHPLDLLAFLPLGLRAPEAPILGADDVTSLFVRSCELSSVATDPTARLLALGRQLAAIAKKEASALERDLRFLHVARSGEALAELEILGPSDDEDRFEARARSLEAALTDERLPVSGAAIKESLAAYAHALELWPRALEHASALMRK
ncbi:MAG: hypothetical protein HYV07_12045 [Deltaproteobacteria bacterium]|nr:hypothetical protein [Deltaproteobacteria bacterium]